MVVELFGESGCGKSTLARFLVENTELEFPSEIHWRNRLCLVLGDSNTRSVFFHLLKTGIHHKRSKRILKDASYLLYLLSVYRMYNSYCKKTVVLDQGLLQYILSIFFFDEADDEFDRLVESVLDSIEIKGVFCFCDHDTLNSRLKKRAADKSEKSRRAEQVQELSKGETLYHSMHFNRIVSHFKERDYCFINTSDELKMSAKEVVNYVNNCNNKRRPV